jgi:Tol biopolymer transport system component
MGSPARIVAQSPVQCAPTWSPDGKWLAFVQLIEDSFHLVKARVDGIGGAVGLLETMWNASMDMILPEWSPTGNWIACGDRQNQLTLVRPDGSASRMLGETGPLTSRAKPISR